MQGFPGSVSVNATYTLTKDDQLQLVMEATADKTTPINLAQHSYFNLNGEASGLNVLNHDLYINGYAVCSQLLFDTLLPARKPQHCTLPCKCRGIPGMLLRAVSKQCLQAFGLLR